MGSGHPVARDEALETPFVAEDVGEKHCVLCGEGAVDGVVGTHHRVDSGVDDGLEMWEVHLVQRVVVDDDVDDEAGVLNRVEREVLDACHHIAAQSPCQGRAHLAGQHRVLAVALLCAPPSRMAQQVDAYGARVVRAADAGFPAHRESDALLQLGVPRRRPHDRHRERGGLPDDDSTRSIAEPDARYAEPRNRATGNWA